MTKLAILGAGGHGRVVAEIAESLGWSDVTFFDERWPDIGLSGSWPVDGNQAVLLESLSQFDGVVIGIGDNKLRFVKSELLLSKGANLVNIIAPSAVVSSKAEVGLGTVVMPNASVGYAVKLGFGCILNTGCTVDHDSVLADAVHIGPGANLAGEVCVGKEGWIGIGASICNQLNVGEGAIVGAGSVVISDVEAHSTVVGVPARKVRK